MLLGHSNGALCFHLLADTTLLTLGWQVEAPPAVHRAALMLCVRVSHSLGSHHANDMALFVGPCMAAMPRTLMVVLQPLGEEQSRRARTCQPPRASPATSMLCPP